MRFRVLAILAALAAAFVVAVLPADGQTLDQQLSDARSRAAPLRAQVAAEEARIARTSAGLASAQRRLDAAQAAVRRADAELAKTEGSLLRTRNRLVRLTNRQREATTALEDNLRSTYERPRLDLVSVVVKSSGFSSLLDQVEFLKRVAKQDARILDNARSTKAEVKVLADRLVTLVEQDRRQAAIVERRRDAARVLQTALARQRERQEARRQQRAARLGSVEEQIGTLRRRQARAVAAANRAAAARTRAATGPVPSGIRVDRGGMAQASAGAPQAVRQIIAAGNAIAGLPYVYGGGHGSFQANGYDCSGSISYALAAAGLLASPLASGGFTSWGEAGPGRHVTVYANAGHAFMVVDGWRFDTSALRSGGTRWTREMRPTGGFVARHPPGL